MYSPAGEQDAATRSPPHESAIRSPTKPPCVGQSEFRGQLRLAATVCAWYGSNVAFNLVNKQSLAAFPNPLTVTALQFGVGSLAAVLLLLGGPAAAVSLDRRTLLRAVPLAVVHSVGNVLTNVSLVSMSVAFTHTVKAR